MMREPSRIMPFVIALYTIWSEHPHLRFSQLVNWIQGKTNTDPFYVEDEELMKIMEDMIDDM